MLLFWKKNLEVRAEYGKSIFFNSSMKREASCFVIWKYKFKSILLNLTWKTRHTKDMISTVVVAHLHFDCSRNNMFMCVWNRGRGTFCKLGYLAFGVRFINGCVIVHASHSLRIIVSRVFYGHMNNLGSVWYQLESKNTDISVFFIQL